MAEKLKLAKTPIQDLSQLGVNKVLQIKIVGADVQLTMEGISKPEAIGVLEIIKDAILKQ